MDSGTGEKTRKLLRASLLVILVGLLGWYFWDSYKGHGALMVVEKRLLTPHDGFLGIHVGKGGQCWVVGKQGVIFHSGDSGKSWKEQVSGTIQTLTAVSFADDQHGFVVGSGGTVLATSDGGLSWKAQSGETDEHLLYVQALSRTEVVAVGAFGTIISTSDGGKTWKRQKLLWEKLIPRLFEGGISEANLNAVNFVSQKVGWVVGEFGLILHTNDGGQSWMSQRYGTDFPQLYSLAFRDECTGWAVGQKGSIIQTSDIGQHWAPLKLGTERDLYAISLPGEHGIIVGDGVGFKTNDGGSTWRRIESIPDNLWLSGVSVASRTAIAVGQFGAIKVINLTNEDPKGESSVEGK